MKLKGGFLDGPLRGHDSDVDDTGKNKAQDPMDGDFGLHHRQTHTHMFAQIMPINWIDKTYYPWFDSFSTFDITSPEEMETEKKFDEGMLVKLSKITDLMSRLETYDDLGEGDRKRMQSSIAQYCDVYT